jgi:hypothetical protein
MELCNGKNYKLLEENQKFILTIDQQSDIIKHMQLKIDKSEYNNARIEELELELEYKEGKMKQQEDYFKEAINDYREKNLSLSSKLEIYEKQQTTCTTNNNTVSNSNNTVNNIIVSSLDIMEDPSKLNALIDKYYSTDYFIEGQVMIKVIRCMYAQT